MSKNYTLWNEREMEIRSVLEKGKWYSTRQVMDEVNRRFFRKYTLRQVYYTLKRMEERDSLVR